jgi:hypothetical protein
LFDQKTAVIAVALFVAVGPSQDLGAFATYDAMAIFLLALASWLTLRATGRLSEPLLIAAGLTLALGDAAKYATGLWNPVVFILAALTAASGGWVRAACRGMRLMVYTAAPLAFALFHYGGHTYIKGILFTTLARANSANSVQTVLWTAATYIGILFALAIAGAVARLRGPFSPREKLIAVTLTLAMALAPVEEARIHTITSLYKHVVFGAWFGAIIAGYALARASEINRAKGWRIATVVASFMLVISLSQAAHLFSYWPSTAQIEPSLEDQIRQTRGPVLAESKYVTYYDMNASVALASRITNYYYLADSTQDIPQANLIQRGYFSVVETEFTQAQIEAGNNPILRALRQTSGYHVVRQVPWRDAYTHGLFQIWRYEQNTSQYPPAEREGQ